MTVSTEHRTPTPVQRPGCPCQVMPIYRITTTQNSGTALTRDFAAMHFVHQARNGQIKNSLSLDHLHHQLQAASFPLQHSGASNLLVSKISFDCLITDRSRQEHRDYITFPLKISGAYSNNVFSSDLVERMYGGKQPLYAAMKHFYTLGRSIANPQQHKHGHIPDYAHNSSRHDQYIKHTEQLLVAYLATPEAARLLSEQLRSILRTKYTDVESVKIYHMGLHMHSTKTCCAPCEYALVGLMNEQNGVTIQGKTLSLLSNFKRVCSEPNEFLSIRFPQSTPFRLLVTVTANDPDADHKTQPCSTHQPVPSQQPHPFTPILVKDPANITRIFLSKLNSQYNKNESDCTNLTDLTVAISGSLSSAGSPNTIKTFQTTRSAEDNNFPRLEF